MVEEVFKVFLPVGDGYLSVPGGFTQALQLNGMGSLAFEQCSKTNACHVCLRVSEFHVTIGFLLDFFRQVAVKQFILPLKGRVPIWECLTFAIN